LGKVKLSEVKSVLSAVHKARSQNAKLLMPNRGNLSARAANERKKLLTSLVKKAGLDISKLEQIQDKHPHVDRRPSQNLTKEYSWRANSIIQNAKDRIAISNPNQQTIQIQPLFVWSIPAILESSNIGPYDNWAKTRIDSTVDGGFTFEVNFLYLWENPSDLQATVDAQTYLGFYGYCFIQCAAGFWPGIAECQSTISAQLNVYGWWNLTQPFGPSKLSSAAWLVEDMLVEGGGFWELPPTKSVNVLSFPDLTVTGFVVPPGATVVFEANATFNIAQNDGEATFDFNQSGYQITSPYLELDISYPEVSING
jgi:hypothetical protein